MKLVNKPKSCAGILRIVTAKITGITPAELILIGILESKFGVAIVYDIHSYNWKRWAREVPTWNLGTSNLDNERFGTCIEAWRRSLSELKLPNNIKIKPLIRKY